MDVTHWPWADLRHGFFRRPQGCTDRDGLSRLHNEGAPRRAHGPGLGGPARGRFAAERGRSGADPGAPGGVIERHITGFFRIFSNTWFCPGNTTSIPLYRTVVH